MSIHGTGADTLIGGAGNDTIIGGSGDVVQAGAGNDTLRASIPAYSSNYNLITFAGGEGRDTFESLGTNYYYVQVAFDSVEVLRGNGAFTVAQLNSFEEIQVVSSIRLLDSGRVDLTNKVTSATNTRDSGAKYFILNGTNGPDELIKLDAKTQISLYGGNGNDTLITGVGNDYIDDNGGWVGQNNDSINSGDGNDTIYGQVDDDIIIAWGSEADGNDLAVGGGGNDYIEGGAGNDHLYGHESGSPVWINGGAFFSDTLDGGAGQDVLYGSAGGDLLIGGSEAEGADKSDTIYGNDGNDTIFGGSGNDTVHAGVGDDLANGGLGADTIAGGDGNDSLNGQGLSDYLFGNAGDDYLNGGFGYDRLNGGTGADQFYHLGNVNHGSDWIQDYTAADGDVLVWGGGAAAESDFLVQRANTASAGSADVDEVFITHVPSGLLAWALVDGDAQTALNVRVGDATFDLLA